MVVSESLSKWGMRFYPPLFFQRIWVVKIDKGFKGVKVKINKSIFNKNYNNAIFGGTIFSAADPFYPLLFHQLFSHKGYNVIAWSKSSEIRFIKPALTKLYFYISLSDDDIAEAEHVLNTGGKYTKSHPIDIYNTNGEICVTLMNEIYLRNVNFKENL
ncbi:DUF4442 domain-containing protein [Mucilaginibacter sp.]|uniref:DUF4442 domain-containing protein n=1 Tax=Mucilaginibacter sp. TaxID=1882438 RepID=UPI00262E95EF|nr:DUF4442 domain-containing protein [Mucilaginibacter sp.]MDB5032472.1 hypothetical protein [Mucilaginibacter sp.]